MKKSQKLGFSLVELSIVLVIGGLLLVGTLTVVAVQFDAANVNQTKTKLDKIERAVQLYYDTSGYLPCPAEPDLASTDADFALSQEGVASAADGTLGNATCVSVTGAGNAYIGVVPTRTLSLPDEFLFDAWGDRITYAVTQKCVDGDNWLPLSSATDDTYDVSDPATTSPHGCIDTAVVSHANGGGITVNDNNPGGVTPRTVFAAYVLVSHGKNGIGAYNRNGARVTDGVAAATAHELENANLTGGGADNFDDVFRDDRLLDFDGAVEFFDDLVRWKIGAQIQYEKEN